MLAENTVKPAFQVVSNHTFEKDRALNRIHELLNAGNRLKLMKNRLINDLKHSSSTKHHLTGDRAENRKFGRSWARFHLTREYTYRLLRL